MINKAKSLTYDLIINKMGIFYLLFIMSFVGFELVYKGSIAFLELIVITLIYASFSSVIMFTQPKMRCLAHALLNVVNVLVLMFDGLIKRTYDIFLPPHYFYNLNEIMILKKELIANMKPQDTFLLVILILVVWAYLFLFKKNNSNVQPFKKKATLFLSVNALSAIALLLVVNMNVKADGLGILYHHITEIKTYHGKQMASSMQETKLWLDIQKEKSDEKKYFGLGKGKNVIAIQINQLQDFMVNAEIDDQEITPNLNELKRTSFYFDNIFNQTADKTPQDTEFAISNSIYPTSDIEQKSIIKSNSLPNVLKDNAYTSYLVNGRNGLRNNSPYSDYAFEFSKTKGKESNLYNQAMDVIEEIKEPYYMTIQKDPLPYPYDVGNENKALIIKNQKITKPFFNVLQYVNYQDRLLGEFIEKLKKEGEYENAIFVIYGTYDGQQWKESDLKEYLNTDLKLSTYFIAEQNRIPFIIHVPNLNKDILDHTVGGYTELLPTVANLLGIEKAAAVYSGYDLLNQTDGFVNVTYPDISFATGDYFYLPDPDKVFDDGKCYNRRTAIQVETRNCKNDFLYAQWYLNMQNNLMNYSK